MEEFIIVFLIVVILFVSFFCYMNTHIFNSYIKDSFYDSPNITIFLMTLSLLLIGIGCLNENNAGMGAPILSLIVFMQITILFFIYNGYLTSALTTSVYLEFLLIILILIPGPKIGILLLPYLLFFAYQYSMIQDLCDKNISLEYC